MDRLLTRAGPQLCRVETPLDAASAYMLLEQVQRLPIDRRTDMWTLGVVICEMVTARVASEPCSSEVRPLIGARPKLLLSLS